MKNLLGIGALIDRAWEQYRKNFKVLIKISAWMLIITAINIIAMGFYPVNAAELTRSLNGWEIFGMVLFLLNNTVFAFVIGIWVVNALITAIHTQADGGKITMADLHKKGWSLFLPQLVVRILLALIFAASVAVPLILFWVISNFAISFLPTIVFFLLLFAVLILFLPPLMLLVYLAFSVFALVDDGFKGIDAIKESARLVKGRFWAVFARLAIPKLLYFGVFFIAQFLLAIVLQVIVFGIIGDVDSLAFMRANLLILPTSYTILFVLINPILLITDHEIYQDLK